MMTDAEVEHIFRKISHALDRLESVCSDVIDRRDARLEDTRLAISAIDKAIGDFHEAT